KSVAEAGSESALTPLRRADSDPASATDLVAVVEQVEHVGADRQSLEHSRSVEVLSNPRVEHPVAGKGAAVGNDAVGIVGSKAGAVNEVHRRDQGADFIVDRVAAAARC